MQVLGWKRNQISAKNGVAVISSLLTDEFIIEIVGMDMVDYSSSSFTRHALSQNATPYFKIFWKQSYFSSASYLFFSICCNASALIRADLDGHRRFPD